MLVCALLVLAMQDANVSYEPFAGLQVKLNGVPYIVGSSFQYFDARTGKGLYSSRWAPKEVSRLPDGTIRVRYTGDNGNVIGTHEFIQRPGGLTVRYEFRWRGDGDVKVENSLAQFWAPAVCHGDIDVDNNPLVAFESPAEGDWAARRLGAGNSFEFDTSVARTTLTVKGGRPSLYDARGYSQDWAKHECLFWLGDQSLTVHQGETTSVTAEWEFEPRHHAQHDAEPSDMAATSVSDAVTPPTNPNVLVPKPKSVESAAGSLDVQGTSDSNLPKEIVDGLGRSWKIDPSTIKFPCDARIDAVGLQPEGFELRVTPTGVSIRAHDDLAMRYAKSALVQLGSARGGRLVIPCGTWRDWPSVVSRGIHLFAAHGETEFQNVLIDRLLSPLRFNRAVVESSRVQWDASSDSKSKPWATKDELATFFLSLRTHGIDPVPLIQSFGHMDWLLDGQFRDLAINPEIPFTLDARKAKARDLVKSVWREAVDLLKPKVVHFGLDEISMRGMPDDPTLPARLWKVLIPDLALLCRELKVTPMAWSDMMLAEGEAPDATHARNAADAAAFRALLPRGTIVGDWHYIASKDPNRFTSLALWKSLGMNPVATSWYQPENIRSQTLAAIAAGAGTLQATWAGYETNEEAVIRDPAQFAAYVLAADYAWSGRDDAVATLPYNPGTILRQLLWGVPQAVKPVSGQCWTKDAAKATAIRIGNVRFQSFSPIGLQTPLTPPGSSCPASVQFSLNAQATEIWLALDCVGWQHDTDPVAKVTVVSDEGQTTATILYGADVRASEDARPAVRCESKNGISAFRIPLGGVKNVKSMRIEPISATAGLRIRGVTTL